MRACGAGRSRVRTVAVERVVIIGGGLAGAEAALCIIATGPLTGAGLARALAGAVGDEALAFYDAIAPIVAGESIDRTVAFQQSRYGKGGGDDYLNLPLTRDEYEQFVDALLSGEKVQPHAFEEP